MTTPSEEAKRSFRETEKLRVSHQKCKVLFVNRFFHPDDSATSQILTDLAFHLAKSGLEVHVIATQGRQEGLPTGSELVGGVHVHRVRSPRLHGNGSLLVRLLEYLAFYFGAAALLFKHVDAGTIVVVKTDPPLLSVLVAPIAARKKAKLINWLQDVYPEVASSLRVIPLMTPILPLIKWARNLSLRSACANVVLGSRMDALIRNEGIPAGKVCTIPNWADGQALQPIDPDVNPLRKEWGLDKKFVVGYSGNFGRAHQFQTIMDAAERLQKWDEIVFLFIGGGVQKQIIEKEAARRGTRNVLFRPYQPRGQLSYSLSAADVHLVTLNPALEGMIVPSKFYGIAAVGRPTITIGDQDGEIARIVRDAKCGYAVAEHDTEALIQRIQQLFKQPARRQEMGNMARTLLENRFERRLALQAWENLLARL